MPLIVPRVQSGSPLQVAKMLWGPIYEAVLSILGSTGTILPFGDPDHGQPNGATFTTVGEEQVTFTWSEAPSLFETPFDIGPDSDSWQGVIPVITFDGVDEEADSPDAAYWTRADAAFSVGAWVNLADATESTILSKFDAAGNTREWVFWFGGADKLRLHIYDEDDAENDYISVVANAAQAQNVWASVIATCDGSTDELGLNLYVNGATIAQTQDDSGNFGSMRDKTGTVKLGHYDATPTHLFDGMMAGGPLGPFFTQVELSADAVKRLYNIGRAALKL